MSEFKNHNLVPEFESSLARYELRPCLDTEGNPIDGLHNAWIILDNPSQYNSYTTDMVKDVILNFRRASNARDVVAVVFTGVGHKAFCTGGNTKEYAEYYAGQPEEYRQYMRLFNDMVTAILQCDKPVICRANGMRVGGGQEIGMACDFTVASDTAVFGQAGPKHGSAPDGGSTDFLPLFVGIEEAMMSCTACEPWSAYKAHRLGLITDVFPVLKKGDAYINNPMVVTDRWLDDSGKMCFGEMKRDEAKRDAREFMRECEVDLSLLDKEVERLCTSLLMTFPGCLIKTIGSIRKHKLEHWDKNRETNREWLGLNMMNEAKAGFRAFNEGARGHREVDFIKLRKMLAEGHRWGDELIEAVMPPRKEEE